jgi:hypothetical protein
VAVHRTSCKRRRAVTLRRQQREDAWSRANALNLMGAIVDVAGDSRRELVEEGTSALNLVEAVFDTAADLVLQPLLEHLLSGVAYALLTVGNVVVHVLGAVLEGVLGALLSP